MDPEKRNIALSFQENCLFPHYNVIDNIKFGADRNKDKKFNFSVHNLINLFFGIENSSIITYCDLCNILGLSFTISVNSVSSCFFLCLASSILFSIAP